MRTVNIDLCIFAHAQRRISAWRGPYRPHRLKRTLMDLETPGSFFLNLFTDNPLYTDTRYKDKLRYNDNLTVTKPSLKR